VFGSWFNARAKYYRKMNQIPDDLGTAVNVQAMVFGNLGETSATGVGFTRNPATGEKAFYGEFLENAQGEDVVSGVRTPHPISELLKWNAAVYNQLRDITTMLEKHYRDIQDFEFTIQDGKLYMLQTRNGKRTGPAAVRIAVEMVGEGLITRRKPSCASTRSSSISFCTRCSTRHPRRRWPSWPRACRPRPARRSAPSCSRPTTR
jgi:pyruvate,orthophosphate dikinase